MEFYPLVSIIIPIYNASAYLKQCIESVINQTYTNLEIILINDGSTDDSGAICDSYALKDARIKVVHKPNGGISDARYTGACIMSGCYGMFIDSDDWIELNTIEACIDTIRVNSVDCVFFPYIKEYSNKSIPTSFFNESLLFEGNNAKKIYRRLFGLVGEELKYPEKMDNFVTCWGKLYTKKSIKSGKYIDTKQIGTEDLLFNIYALKDVRSYFYINTPLYHYRKQVNNSLTISYKAELSTQWKRLYSMIEDTIHEFALGNEFKTALNNRISLSSLGIGTNELKGPFPILKRMENLSNYLNDNMYKNAVKNQDTAFLPIKWKVFLFCSKHNVVIVLYWMLVLIKKIRERGI